MNRAEFVKELASVLNIPCCTAKRYTIAMLEVLSKRLEEKESVQFKCFGTFQVKITPERMARNPKTKETVVIPERSRVVFRSSPMLLDRLNKESKTDE